MGHLVYGKYAAWQTWRATWVREIDGELLTPVDELGKVVEGVVVPLIAGHLLHKN